MIEETVRVTYTTVARFERWRGIVKGRKLGGQQLFSQVERVQAQEAE